MIKNIGYDILNYTIDKICDMPLESYDDQEELAEGIEEIIMQNKKKELPHISHKMKILYKGKKVAETDTLGSRFVKAFIFPDQGYHYKWHEITFAYENIKNDQAEIKPVKLEKVICDFETIDEYGFKQHFKVTKQPLSELNKLTKDRDLWETQ